MKINSFLIISLVIVINVNAGTLPQYASEKHMGVATCSSGVCHGKSVEDKKENVMLNEYRTWLQYDDHSGAYKTLLKPTSKKIAAKLGLKSAHTAKICLDCHADNIPVEKRGKKFQISDGVACEACHGGAQKWLSDHKEPGATHEKNIALGLYPSEKPKDRAKLCLSCHLGTANKFATHRIMAAGHPRLSFELESFTQNQPAHYKVDADYEKRKGSIRSVNMWLTGLVFKANEQLALLTTKQYTAHGFFPELSFYECHSCHRSMAVSRWPVERNSNNVPAGTVRLDDSSLVVLISVVDSLSTKSASKLKTLLKDFHRSSVNNKQSLLNAAQALQQELQKLSSSFVKKKYSKQQKLNFRKKLLLDASKGYFRDYSSAEQLFYAVETLSLDLNDFNKYEAMLDKLFNAIDKEDKFYPSQFQTLAKLFLNKLP